MMLHDSCLEMEKHRKMDLFLNPYSEPFVMTNLLHGCSLQFLPTVPQHICKSDSFVTATLRTLSLVLHVCPVSSFVVVTRHVECVLACRDMGHEERREQVTVDMLQRVEG